jgi:hypothetical protein
MTPTSFNLPFPEFYDSILSQELDHVESQECEYFEEYRQDEDGIAENQKLTAQEYADILYRHTSYDIAHHAIARRYCEALDHILSERFEFSLRLEFEEMTSPREYNFATDRIFAAAPIKTLAKLFAMSHRDGHKILAAAIKERFTSRSGFISHYRSDLDSWLEKPLRDWDHNETGTLLRACIALTACPHEESLEWLVFSSLTDGATFYTAWSESVDWTAVDSDIAELRAEKLADFYLENPEEAPDGKYHHIYMKHPDQIEMAL